jgi:hypothetical protein
MTSKLRLPVALAFIVGMLAASVSVSADEHDNDNDIDTSYEHAFEIHGFDFEEPEFYGVWERTDRPVLEGDVARSWLWGPAANTEVFEEPYEEADDGTREVQYGDKSRMEMPVPGSTAAAPEDSPWAITQGLLAIELMTGNLQLGDDTFEQYEPADIPVAGDWENNPGPTYAHMAQFMDWEPRPAGSVITQYLDLEEDTVLDDDRFAEYEVTDVGGVWQEVEGIDNNIASVFWEFMQSEGLVYEDGDLTEGPLFLDEFYAIGYPTTEAYWGVYRLRGEIQDILTQCFERRCLTYAPDNDPEWQVESGNVGLHYHEWRYNIIDIDDPITDDDDDAIVDDEDDAIVDDEDDAIVDDEDDAIVDDEDDAIVDDEDDAIVDDEDDGIVDDDDDAVDDGDELSGTFDFDGESDARVEVGEDIVLTAHVTENGDSAEGETVYFWISEDGEDVISISPFSAETGVDGTAEVTVTGLAEGAASVNAFVDLDGSGTYNEDTDVDLGSVEIIVGPIPPEEFEAAASGSDDVVSEGQLDDGRDYWQIEIFLTEDDRDAGEALRPQDAWDAGDLTQIIYERPDGTTVDLEPEGTDYLWWVGTYADGEHTIYYLVDGEWYAVTSTFEDGELIEVGGEAYVSP